MVNLLSTTKITNARNKSKLSLQFKKIYLLSMLVICILGRVVNCDGVTLIIIQIHFNIHFLWFIVARKYKKKLGADPM